MTAWTEEQSIRQNGPLSQGVDSFVDECREVHNHPNSSGVNSA